MKGSDASIRLERAGHTQNLEERGSASHGAGTRVVIALVPLVLFLLNSEQVGSLVFSNDRKNMPEAPPVSEGYDRYTAKSHQILKGTTVRIITVAMVSQRIFCVDEEDLHLDPR
jgi:hypothetical protein